MDDDAASAAAVEEAMACAAESVAPLVVPRLAVFVVAVVVVGLPAVGGFQFRKEVQILHGLPSGPRTMPGGSGRALEDAACAVGLSALLVPVLIVAPRQSQTRSLVLRHRAGFPALRLVSSRDVLET